MATLQLSTLCPVQQATLFVKQADVKPKQTWKCLHKIQMSVFQYFQLWKKCKWEDGMEKGV